MTLMNHLDIQTKPETQLFWNNTLQYPLPCTTLPEDKTRPTVLTHRNAVYQHPIATELSQAIARFCRANNQTTLPIYIVSVALLLGQLNASDNAVLGVRSKSTVSHQRHAVLPLLLTLEPNASIAETLRQTQARLEQVNRHADITLGNLIETAGLPFDQSKHPIFQVAVECNTDSANQAAVQSDISLDLIIRFEKNQMHITYAQDLYQYDSIVRMAQRLITVLDQICARPDAALQTIIVIPEAEHAALATLYDSQLKASTFSSIPQMIADSVRTQPTAPAIRDQDRHLTYQDLERLSDQAAALLAEQGVIKGSMVGVNLLRRPEIVAWLLGILKLGAIYVPIDINYPDARVKTLLNDAPCAFCLVDADRAQTLPQSCQRINASDAILHASPVCKAPNDPAPQADDTAYLIYTSGSTGCPKGIRISHGNVVNLLEWTRDTFSHADLRCVAATTSLNFDMSIFEIFGTLAAGGTLLMLDDALDIVDSPLQHEITLIDTVPSAIATLLPLATNLEACRVVNLGGEALPRHLCNQIHTALPGVRLYNMYGPSETTTFSTFALVPAISTAPPNIGKPLRNTQLLVLNETGSLTPTGMIGELFIGGSGVTQGYLNRPELTKEKYVACGIQRSGGQFFRTGDLVSLGADGELRYHGRIDHQIKIRGHRVEPGEIDVVLTDVAGVEKAITIGTALSGRVEIVLVSYVTGSSDVESLKAHVATRLPSYMVPNHIVPLKALPLNANGKLDRSRLPDPTDSPRILNPPATW